MSSTTIRLARFGRSLYARIVVIYLASLFLLSIAAAWTAVSQFGHLSEEMQQRMQLGLAKNLADVLQKPLEQGVTTQGVEQSVQQILSINPSLSLYLLDASGRMIGNYGAANCPSDANVDTHTLQQLLREDAMLPVFVSAPCSHQSTVFSVAPIHYGKNRSSGYLLVLLGGEHHMSMFSMLRTSSITHTLIFAGLLALIIAGAVALLLFALLTRRFSTLTQAVERFAEGDYQQRIPPGHNDEIGLLGQAFNDMARTIEAQLDALRENDRQRRELVSGLSHDFRTPLTSLRGYAERLQASDASIPDRQALDAILANTQRLTQLASQLSTLSRVDAYEEELQLEPFSLGELACDVAGKFQPQAQSSEVSLTVQCSRDNIQVTADIALIDRALANLVDNALRATPAGGQVQLLVQIRDDKASVSVTDTGVGLSAEEIPLVTQRFYRTESGRERGEGSGLGLAIVQEICERHGTRLTIRSKLGEGTKMQFDLALAQKPDIDNKTAHY
jgi:signal transduction histidine kinase